MLLLSLTCDQTTHFTFHMHKAEKTLPLYSQQVDLLHFHLERLATNLGCQKKRQILHIIVSV